MLYGDNVHDTRQMYFSSWKNYLQKKPLSPLEQQIVDVILAHPEYHTMLESSPAHFDQAYFPEMGQTNPFLHMGLHLAIRDQLATDRPSGISDIYHKLVQKYGDPLATEHLIMEYLAECLWQAQRNHSEPNEKDYLNALRGLL